MKFKRTLLVAFACLALFALIGMLHERVLVCLERGVNHRHSEDLLPSPEAAKICTLGFDQLLADWYWLGFIQYIGDTKACDLDHYAAADKYLQLIVALDPAFVQAYWFAAFIIGREENQPERAAAFLERGIQANPNNWYLPFIAGINQYLYARNDVAAAKYYKMASKFPNAPPWLSRQADILAARIPERIKEINVWDSIYHSTADAIVRDRAHKRLVALWSEVFKTATTQQIKNKAQASLRHLGVDPIDSDVHP